ncbi:TetR/AcrR family transcriptional regulator [Xenophilus azovorans]|uniref:TetR/AcrR family transcriptional regulator n=1 Tax=Xenophilus azovorans TaxID=151755 RepID=UPI0005718AA1|nr:TetR/AcrR family transcriptional regulator [Xenophilus azovorans]
MASLTARRPDPEERPDAARIREEIKRVAQDLFIRHGLIKMTLGMVAEELGMSRPSIHYYYRTKARLAEAVLEDYARISIARSQENWLDPETTLAQKFKRSLDASRERYRFYNARGKGDRPWSLFARFYQELDLLTPVMETIMKSAAREQQSYYGAAVNLAKARGELLPEAPTLDLSVQIVGMLHQVGWLTWASGSFAAVETAYATTLTSIQRAYGPAFRAAPARARG